MSGSKKDIETLIVRQLDGELTEDEQLELNRELIRDPEARRMMDAYKRIDELAGTALEDAFGAPEPAFDVSALPGRGVPIVRRRYHRGWWLVPGAIAAALLAVVVARFPYETPSDRTVTDRRPRQASPVVPVVGPGAGSQSLIRNVGTNPLGRRINRHTGREIIGVIGEDGNMYWIEVDRTQTVKRPPPRVEF